MASSQTPIYTYCIICVLHQPKIIIIITFYQLLGDMPHGSIKLYDQISELVQVITELEPMLREESKKVQPLIVI
jgi:hypothetical protein